MSDNPSPMNHTKQNIIKRLNLFASKFANLVSRPKATNTHKSSTTTWMLVPEVQGMERKEVCRLLSPIRALLIETETPPYNDLSPCHAYNDALAKLNNSPEGEVCRTFGKNLREQIMSDEYVSYIRDYYKEYSNEEKRKGMFDFLAGAYQMTQEGDVPPYVTTFVRDYLTPEGNSKIELILFTFMVYDVAGIDPLSIDQFRYRHSKLLQLLHGPRTTEEERKLAVQVREKIKNSWYEVNDAAESRLGRLWVRYMVYDEHLDDLIRKYIYETLHDYLDRVKKSPSDDLPQFRDTFGTWLMEYPVVDVRYDKERLIKWLESRMPPAWHKTEISESMTRRYRRDLNQINDALNHPGKKELARIRRCN